MGLWFLSETHCRFPKTYLHLCPPGDKYQTEPTFISEPLINVCYLGLGTAPYRTGHSCVTPDQPSENFQGIRMMSFCILETIYI